MRTKRTFVSLYKRFTDVRWLLRFPCFVHLSYLRKFHAYFRSVYTSRGSKKKNPPSNNIHVRSIMYRDMLRQISSILRAYIDLEMAEE